MTTNMWLGSWVSMTNFASSIFSHLWGRKVEPVADDLERHRAHPDMRSAAHEAGHAVVAWASPYVRQIERVWIDSNGGRVAYTASRASTVAASWYALTIALGGIAGEAIVVRSFRSYDARKDLSEAIDLARKIAASGPHSTPWDGDEPPADGFDVGRVYTNLDARTRRVLNLAYARAKGVIRRDKARFDTITLCLLESRTLEAKALTGIFGLRLFHL